jgi:hypothetical protein
MPAYKPEDVRMMLVDSAFQSDAFIVAKGKKTKWMLEVDAERALSGAKKSASGQPGLPPKMTPDPDPAPLPVVEKLAGVVKFLAAGDQNILTIAKKNFEDHFAGVFLSDGTDVGAVAGQLFDAATTGDSTYQELRRLGMAKEGEAYGMDSVVRFVKRTTFRGCMPNGDLADDFPCLITLLELDEELLGGKLRWSEMDGAPFLNGKLVEPTELISELRYRIGTTYSVVRGKQAVRFDPSHESVGRAIEYLARKDTFHAAREALDAMPAWDGVDRFWDLLEMIGGLQEILPGMSVSDKNLIRSRNELAYAQLWKTFVGSVARTYEPGCKMDTMLVLKSKQGSKKSSLFRALSPGGRFSDTHLDFGNKDSYMQLQKNSWYECAELSGLLKKEVQVIKNFISSQNDTYRMPFARAVTDNPRHCILVGTTNDDTPFKDPTGSRRFWIIEIDDSKEVQLYMIKAIVPQLWAQAIHTYRAAGTCPDCLKAFNDDPRCPEHRWWLTKEQEEVRTGVNARFTEVDPMIDWFGQMLLDGVRTMTNAKQGGHFAEDTFNPSLAYSVRELIAFVPGMKDKQTDLLMQRRMTAAVKAHGWKSKHTMGGNVWYDPKLHVNLKIISGDAEKVSTSDRYDKVPELTVVKKASGEEENK